MGVNAVLVTKYDNYEDITFSESEDYAAAVAEMFASFGIEREEPLRGRVSAAELNAAVKTWNYSTTGTVVYWLGHGAGPGTPQSPGRLLHSASAREDTHDGLLHGPLADGLAKLDGNTKWVVLIIEACRIDAFVRALKECLREKSQQYMCPTLILFSSKEVTSPGSVLSVLKEVIDDVCGADAEVPLAKIAYEFELRLSTGVAYELLHVGRATLTRTTQLPAGQTLDVHRQLRAVVDALPPDERQHFVAKAQSAGSGELTWNFEGRAEERRAVRSWLDTDDAPICIVRGEAGQGKSAFLGDIVTRSRPDLCEALVQARLMTAVDSWTDLGTPNTVISINASGLTTRHLLDRILEGLGESADTDADTDRSVERVAARVASMDELVLFIIDGIDEMQEPIEGARFIGTLSARCQAKVLVACRDTPNEGRQYLSFVHPNLVQAIADAAPTGKTLTITMQEDEGAIVRYIQKRLAQPSDGLVIPDPSHVAAKNFLHARLLVDEILAEPDYLDPELLGELLQLELPGLFDVMLGRLKRLNPAFIPIFQACALSQGRGLPLADDVWLIMAREVAASDEGLDHDALAAFLRAAEPYLRIDIEFDQTVYRPAHSLLRDHLLSTLGGVTADYHVILARLCATHVGAAEPNAYYRHAATLHAKGSHRRGWWEIDRIKPSVWPRLESSRVVEDAMRDLFGRANMPSGVEELVLRHHIDAEFGGSRAVEGWAQAMREGGYPKGRAGEAPHESPRLHWARDIVRQPLFLSLTGHPGQVTAIEDARLGPDESGVLVGTNRGSVYLWNLASGGLVTEFEGLQRSVTSLCSVADTAHGLVVLGADSTGGITAWSAKTLHVLWPDPDGDPPTARRPGNWLAPKPAAVNAAAISMVAVSPRDNVSAVVVVSEHRIRVVDVHTGKDLCASRPSIRRLGSAVAVSDDVTGTRTIVIGTAGEANSSGSNAEPAGFVELNLQTARRGLKLTVPRFVELPAALMSIRFIQDAQGGFRLLLSQGQVQRWAPGSRPRAEFPVEPGEVVRLGDVSSSPLGLTDVCVIDRPDSLVLRVVDGDRADQIVASHGGASTALRVIDREDGRAVVASGGSDRTVRIWDPYSVGDRKSAHGGHAQRVLAVGAGGGNTLAVVARQGGTLQFVDGSSARTIREFSLGSTAVNLSSSVDNPGRALIAASAASGQVHLWRQNNLERPVKQEFVAHFSDRVVVDVDPTAEFVAAATSGGVVALWRQTRQIDLVAEMQFPASHVTNVKVVRPYGDLAAVVVVTDTKVYTFSVPLPLRRTADVRRTEGTFDGSARVSCLYANGRGVGLVSGADDGQVHILPQLWTGKDGLNVESGTSPRSMNLRQPISAIQALAPEAGRRVLVVGGAYGALAKSNDAFRGPLRVVEFGQPISSVSAHGAAVLAAVQGGVVSFAFGRD
ncbi:peptidase C14 caspase catalytic subunit p20 [Mycolicibacterium mageritense DSM 44476 = CIP 104973]|uniref:NACHT domain-containing protein n=1 Tax=Mycolicibacterium mageritense TaxID=53462 RepID=A0ABM7I546_MYCME|nr:NACHT domain-containing protein [Mycolicibacterium mageritense]MCC9184145.1 NACHT domain-containing protein [Mycolicibacterium mageritense]BBX38027.1 hypothetical protein MMAGJ_73090 [Mycolicibacterium mageritense]CDO25305.1 hypothetical protein BN978_05810 [Mycolicibacterium mageritense DSM 44476 = CIP 104973]